MKPLITALKICTASVWLPLWLTKRGIRFFVVLVIGAVLSSCTSTSGKLDRSPCACSFEPINAISYGRDGDV